MNEKIPAEEFAGPSFNIFRDALFFIALFLISLILSLFLLVYFDFPLIPIAMWLLIYGFTEILLFFKIWETYGRCVAGDVDRGMGITCDEKAYEIRIKITPEKIIYVKSRGEKEEREEVKIGEIKELKLKGNKILYLSGEEWEELGKVPNLPRQKRKKLRERIEKINGEKQI